MPNKTICELEALLAKADLIVDEQERERVQAKEIKNYHGDDEIISFAQARELIPEIYNGFSVKTGVASLDKAFGDIRGNDLVLITGDPKAGKTTLAMTMTANMSDTGIAPLWFNLEGGIDDFLRKFGKRLPNGFIPKSIINRNVVWVERKIIESIAKNQTKVVFVDNFNALDDYYDSKGQQMPIYLGGLAMRFKKMAIKYNITIFLLLHTGKAESGQTVSWKNIRDSQLIANACDSIVCVWRPEKRKQKYGLEYEPYTIAALQANRRFGTMGKAFLMVDDGLFYESTTDYEKAQYDDGQGVNFKDY